MNVFDVQVAINKMLEAVDNQDCEKFAHWINVLSETIATSIGAEPGSASHQRLLDRYMANPKLKEFSDFCLAREWKNPVDMGAQYEEDDQRKRDFEAEQISLEQQRKADLEYQAELQRQQEQDELQRQQDEMQRQQPPYEQVPPEYLADPQPQQGEPTPAEPAPEPEKKKGIGVVPMAIGAAAVAVAGYFLTK